MPIKDVVLSALKRLRAVTQENEWKCHRIPTGFGSGISKMSWTSKFLIWILRGWRDQRRGKDGVCVKYCVCMFKENKTTAILVGDVSRKLKTVCFPLESVVILASHSCQVIRVIWLKSRRKCGIHREVQRLIIDDTGIWFRNRVQKWRAVYHTGITIDYLRLMMPGVSEKKWVRHSRKLTEAEIAVHARRESWMCRHRIVAEGAACVVNKRPEHTDALIYVNQGQRAGCRMW